MGFSLGFWLLVYDSVQLVNITPISLWFMVPITIVFMGFINHLITGGPHIAGNGWVAGGCWDDYHLVMTNIAMERSTISNR